MEPEELNKCLRKFYLSTRKKNGEYYNKATLTSIRSAIERHLSDENKKPFSIISGPQFTEANKALNSFLKDLSKSGKIRPTQHKTPLTRKAIVKLYEAGELVDCQTSDPAKLQQTAWFFITFYFGRRGRENQRQLTQSSFKLCQMPDSGIEYFEINKTAVGSVLATKNHQGSLDGSDDPSNGKMFANKDSPRCPVAVLKCFLAHLNPDCSSLFQKPLSGLKFNPIEAKVWYCNANLATTH